MKYLSVSILSRRLIILGFSFGSCLLRAEVAYVTEDHLVPKNPATDGALRPILERKLFVTPGDCARVLIRPPDTGEAVVAVYRNRAGGSGDQFFVTVTKAEKNIDMTANVDSAEAADRIKIARCDAPIRKTTALAIRSAWGTMLERTHEPRFYARSTLHREELEFSIKGDGQAEVFATLPNKGGRSVSALIKLAKQLETYCHAPVAGRSKLASDIERDARHLVQNEKANRTNSKKQ